MLQISPAEFAEHYVRIKGGLGDLHDLLTKLRTFNRDAALKPILDAALEITGDLGPLVRGMSF